MQIKSIQMENFRQFYGLTPKIEFGLVDRNVTIIIGENGEGKTSLFRALVFCLFGATHLSQDTASDVIHLVNFAKLNETPNLPVEATVVVELLYNGELWTLVRKVKGVKRADKIIEQGGDVVLTIRDMNGLDRVYKDVEEVRSKISLILDENIKEMFLFDGEKIQTLAQNDQSIKKEIKQAITSITQIDSIERTIELFKKAKYKVSKRIDDLSRSNDLINSKIKLDQLKQQLEIKIKEKDAISLEIVDHENKLKDVEGLEDATSELKAKRDKLDSRIALYKERHNSLISEKENYFSKYNLFYSHIFLRDFYNSIRIQLQNMLDENDVVVPIELIKEIFKKNQCICGTCVDDNQEVVNTLKKLEESYDHSKKDPLLSELLYKIKEVETEYQNKLIDFKDELAKLKERIIHDGQEKQEIEEESNELLNQKSGSLNIDYAQQRKNINNELRNLKERLTEKDNEINKCNLDLKTAKDSYQIALNKDSAVKMEGLKLKEITNMIDKLSDICNDYSQDMRNSLMEKTTSVFKKLIAKKDQELISRVMINSKYEIEMYDSRDLLITQDLSQGQRQVASLAFITSLALVASSGDYKVENPLFMDTPFARMSLENRLNLIRELPKLISQWILLLTDTEYSTFEEEEFKKSNRVANIYKLTQVKVNQTIIEQLSINDSIERSRF